MAQSIKSSWFGKEVAVLTVNGKTVIGSVAEATDVYLVLKDAEGDETLIMTHAIVAIKPRHGKPE